MWIVFFAPSAAQATLPSLLRRFSFTSETSGSEQNTLKQEKMKARMAAIGPTTASYLTTRPEKFQVDVISPSPKAVELAKAIRSFDDVTVGS